MKAGTLILIILGLLIILIIIVFVDRIAKKIMRREGLSVNDGKISNKPKGAGNANDQNIINDIGSRYGIKRRKPMRKGH